MASQRALLEVVRDDFGLQARGLTAAGRGALGEVWRLHLDSGPDLAVKLLAEQPPEALVAREVAHVQRLSGHGVRTAACLANRHGRYVNAVAGGWLRVSEWIDGVSPSLDDPLTPVRLGEVLAVMHARAQPAPTELTGWFCRPPEMARLADLVSAAEAADPDWGGGLAAFLPIARELSGVTKAQASPKWCHRDLHPGNVLLTEAGHFAVLDWGCLGAADPTQELASVLLHWFADRTGVHDARATAFLEAYQAAAGPGRLRAVEDFALHVASRLNFLVTQLELAVDAQTAPAERQRATAEIAETLDLLPDMNALERAINRSS